mmetsp:Transcript_103848/g.293698  ORF Transcript_103848/g.293698 Transcript_103848/m.293698 type:complete len:115 (-) Transcript_103848:665-1009(-)
MPGAVGEALRGSPGLIWDDEILGPSSALRDPCTAAAFCETLAATGEVCLSAAGACTTGVCAPVACIPVTGCTPVTGCAAGAGCAVCVACLQASLGACAEEALPWGELAVSLRPL